MKRFNILHFLTMLMVMTFAFSSCSKDEEAEDKTETGTGIHTDTTPKGLEAVDLGLPSGTKWANMNVGATKPEEFGGYYAWGETEEKDWYDGFTYLYYKDGEYIDIGSDIAGTEYDVAHVKWGGNWRMPTRIQIKELLKYTTRTREQINGVRGMRFTATNGNSIFLPAAGERWCDGLYGAGDTGHYWSSTQYYDNSNDADGLYFNSGAADWYYHRYSGLSVRSVSY